KKLSLIFGGFVGLFFSKNKVEKEVMHFERYFPQVKKILIDERNEFMASRLRMYLDEYDLIVAIVGEGHILGLENILQEYASLLTIHLTDIREGKWRELLQTNPI
ncbi:hypothetical protein B6U81_04950, partial [Thermoplasmatales archaeon ex4484_30]